MIFDNGLLGYTISNAAEKSTVTQTVRSGGFLWLNPTAMSVVNCSRAEVVECSRLKPCWYVEGRSYLLIVGKTEIPGLLRLGRVTRLAGKKFLERCPSQALVYG